MSSPAPSDDDPWASFDAAFGDSPEATPPAPAAQQLPLAGQIAGSLDGLAERSTPTVPDEELAGMLSQLEDLQPSISGSLPSAAALPGVASLPGVNSLLGALSRPVLPKMPVPLVPHALSLPGPGRPAFSAPSASVMQLPVSLASAVGHVRLEYRGSSSLKVNHRAVLTLRLHATESGSRCDVCVKSSMFEAPQEYPINCPTPGQYEITTLRLSPREAGDHDVQFELTVTDSQGIPRSRQTGDLILSVAPERETQTIQAGGDVIMLGGAAPLSSLGMSGPGPQNTWQEIPLTEDPAMADRIRRLIPAARVPKPAWNRQVASPLSTSGVIYVGTDAGIVCYAICVGQSASVGRGGTHETTWWVTPVPDRGQLSRLSRRHLSLEFRDEYVWVQDHSGNGVSLNGRKLVRDRAEVIAHRDRIDLAGAIQLSVELDSDDRRIESFQLTRNDGLSQKLRWVLVRPGAWFALDIGGVPGWVTVRDTETIQVEFAEQTQTLRTGEECSLGADRRLAWHRMDGPVDQLQIV